jgi:hypothetical protein
MEAVQVFLKKLQHSSPRDFLSLPSKQDFRAVKDDFFLFEKFRSWLYRLIYLIAAGEIRS